MQITRIEDAAVVMSDGNFTGRRLHPGPGPQVIHMRINPGKAIEPHAAPFDMEFYVLEGEARFTVGGETAEAGAGALVFGPANLPHGIANPGPGPLAVLAIKNT